jgi:septal ring factor EnvC (AmiA/AmiB activator)
MMKTFATFIALVLVSVCLRAQQPTKADLEKQREENQKEIDQLRKMLDETKRSKKASLAEYSQVQRKLQLRQRQINIVNQQINLIEGDINQNWREISKLKKELDTLKIQYAQSIVYSYKNRSNYDFLNFIFSAGNFNEALKRVAYLKSYRNYREQQAANIVHTQELRQEKIAELSANREKKNLALKEESKQKEVLEDEKKEKDVVVSKLKAREHELVKELNDKRKQDQKLAVAIRAAIERAKREAIAEAKRKAAVAPKTNPVASTPAANAIAAEPKKSTRSYSALDADPESRKLSDNFEKNRGSLPWPIESGRISMHFGRQKVEGLTIDYVNPGLTFETEPGKTVKAVFEGEVTAVSNIGPVQMIVIKHGRYFTAYSNLAAVSVNKGQQVKTGQSIGRVAENDAVNGELEFLISNDANHNFDPEKWLR